jgi:hypothetical protein
VAESNISVPCWQVMSRFPSRWVEGHEVTVDACVEGTTDVVSHTEPFLVECVERHVLAKLSR